MMCLLYFPQSFCPTFCWPTWTHCGISSASVFATVGATFSWHKRNALLRCLVVVVMLLLVEAIKRCYNGHEAKAVPGVSTHVPMQLKGGHKEVLQWARIPGLSGSALRLLAEASWRSCNG